MVARDLTTGKVSQPVRYVENPDYKNSKDADPSVPKFLPAEPHIGLRARNDEEREATVQTGYARGGSTANVDGQNLNAEQLDNDGKHVDQSPSEVARIVRDEGPHAANKAMSGKQTPPGDPEPGKDKKGSK